MPSDRLHPRRIDVPDMSADMISARRFAQSWRGYDTEEVTQFLGQVAVQVRALRERCEQAESDRREAEQRASHPQIDEATLMSAVGEETASILRSARSAAAEITAKAQANADSIGAAADTRAGELLAQAEALLAARTAEADLVANQIREHATAEAEHTRELAQQQANELAEVAALKCAETVQAAQAVREKILTDLARRRKLGTVQVEQLRAGRERLLDAYLVVRRTLDEVTDELQRADAEARAASEGAGRQHALDPDELLDLRRQDAWNPGPASPAKMATPTATAVEAPSSGASEAPAGAASLAPRAGMAVNAPSAGEADKHTGPVPPEKTTAQLDKTIAGATAVVSRTDAIESVRILRHEPPAIASVPEPVGSAPEAPEPVVSAPEAVVGAPAPEAALGAPERDEAPVPAGDGPDGSSQDEVQGLFARIRASRAEATTSARKALYEADEGPDAGGNGTGPAGPEGASAGGMAVAAGVDVGASASEGAAEAARGRPGLSTVVEDFFAQRDEVTDRLQGSLARKLKRALQDEQNALLDHLRNLKGPVTPAEALPNVEEQPDRFVDAGRPVLEQGAQAGSDLVATLFTGASPPTQAGPEVIDSLAEELGRAIAEPLRQRLELALRSSGNDPAEMAEALGPAYREWKTQRIEAAARDQVAVAFARGAYLAFPEHALLRWVASPAPGGCADCEDNALAGDQAKGETWPTGQLYPPAHPGCRCALAPAGAEGPVPAAAGASTGTSTA
jgi:DivIVA domain-containing protein